MEPVLKWAGGKRQLLPDIIRIIAPNLEPQASFFEPFVGGGSVFLALAHKKVVINDFNPELINVYEQIRDNPNELAKQLKLHQDNNSHDYYYQVRSLDREKSFINLSPAERAARTIYLNKTCYNGLYRVNSEGYFNVPIGRQKNPDILQEEKITTISNYLRNCEVTIMCGDFAKATDTAQKGDFIYFDPPYDYEESGFTAYTSESFSRDDLLRLRNLCNDLIDRGCKVLVSNNDTTFVNKIFSGDRYEISHIKANRVINSNVSKRKDANEVLVYGK